MHKRAFQALKRTFMHVSGLPPPYFDNKTCVSGPEILYKLFQDYQYGGGSPKYFIN